MYAVVLELKSVRFYSNYYRFLKLSYGITSGLTIVHNKFLFMSHYFKFIDFFYSVFSDPFSCCMYLKLKSLLKSTFIKEVHVYSSSRLIKD